jgi:PAS domain S-box-containing protein
MSAATILVVEDNPITRKMFRVALQSAGHVVAEASDGREALDLARRSPPTLVLQDLRLPDMTGFELAERLRALPLFGETPILAVSGLLNGAEESRIAAAGFQDFLAKPIEPSRLLEVIAAHLRRTAVGDRRGAGRRVLLVDDEPVQQKLMAVRLREMGYVVDTACDGQEALNRARHDPPDAIVSDVLMPVLDGFGLCRAVRQDPRLAHVPVVLVSAAYIEDDDRALATRVGADACVVHTPELSEVLAALAATESPDRVSPQLVVNEFLTTAHLRQVVRQLERQVTQFGTLTRRTTTLTAELAAFDGIARLLARTVDPMVAVRQVLATCLEAGSVSEGAMYFDHHDAPLVLRVVIGFGGAEPGEVESFFGHRELLAQLVAGPAAVRVPSMAVPDSIGRDILVRAGVGALVIAAIPVPGAPPGALVMGSRGSDAEPEEWLTFARTVGTQLGQAIALARTARTNDLLLASTGDGILGADLRGRLTFVNPAATQMLGRTADELLGAPLHDVVHARLGERHCAIDGCGFAALLEGGGGVTEGILQGKGGREIPVEYDCRPIREGRARAGWVVTFPDIRERQRVAEAHRARRKA